MENVMLIFDNVSVYYGKIQVLYNVSLYIKQGEIVMFIGVNGVGKIIFFGMLCGDLCVFSGCIVFDGKDIIDW